jgi:nucleoside-diphosphate-sugar epimerase
MTKPKILITATSGKTGFQSALQLLAAGYSVRAFVRRADHRSAVLNQHGAEILVGSLGKYLRGPASTRRHSTGVFLHAIYWMAISERARCSHRWPKNLTLNLSSS